MFLHMSYFMKKMCSKKKMITDTILLLLKYKVLHHRKHMQDTDMNF